MKNSQHLRNLEAAYNATFTQSNPNFAGSNLKSEAFGRILDEITLRQDRKFYAFTEKNRGGSWVTFMCPCLVDGLIPASESMRAGHKITVLLHWGMKYEFLDDLTSWGHIRCSYKVDNVDYSVVDKFTNEDETNYFNLYDAVIRFKESGIWTVTASEE
jgi:hypothetical protein